MRLKFFSQAVPTWHGVSQVVELARNRAHTPALHYTCEWKLHVPQNSGPQNLFSAKTHASTKDVPAGPFELPSRDAPAPGIPNWPAASCLPALEGVSGV